MPRLKPDTLLLAEAMMALEIAPAEPRDAAALTALHARAYPPGWPESDFARYAASERTPIIQAKAEGEPVAVCILQLVPPEAEVLTVAVTPEWRRRGLGEAVLLHALGIARLADCSCIYLDVAASNFPARTMYKKLGFKEIAQRKNYYAASGDAFIMALDLKS